LKIDDLQDFANLKQLAASLWGSDLNGRGAAVLIGAGFSRCAERASSDTPMPPLWSDLSTAMSAMLHGGSDSIRTDPLRLAEEFRSLFGQGSLNTFLRDHIRDDSWYPGQSHLRLLNLPWVDVLTTNWDTLLERTARKVSVRNYQTVRSGTDLAQVRPPRIVKLHGTVGIDDALIVAEDDYRTYPNRHAAFVNFARQTFIENDLCLVGFSGDDPNFLQWSGWIRDHLGDNSRRIFLIGALNVSQSTRKLLSDRKIVAIDLSPLVEAFSADERHQKAIELWLDYMKRARPIPAHEWRPKQTDPQTHTDADFFWRLGDGAGDELLRLEQVWKQERLCYPGWLVCPFEARRKLQMLNSSAQPYASRGLMKLRFDQRATVLYELNWRLETGLLPLDDGHRTRIAEFADPATPCGISVKQQLELAISLLRSARERDDDLEFEKWRAVISANSNLNSEECAESAYQLCLRMRDRLMFQELEHTLPAISNAHAIWKMRKASLQCDLKHFDEARDLYAEALADLRDRERDDRSSIWLRSRRAWAQWLAAASQKMQSLMTGAALESTDFHTEATSKCSPWIETEALAREVSEVGQRQRASMTGQVVPQFASGSYVEPQIECASADGQIEPCEHAIRRVMETVGIPIEADHASTLPFYAEALTIKASPTANWHARMTRALESKADDHAYNLRLRGRIAMARLPQTEADVLTDRMLSAAEYWALRARTGVTDHAARQHSLNALKCVVASLYRLTPRMNHERATRTFRLGLSLLNDPALRYFWLLEPIRKLFRHSLESLSGEGRGSLVLEALQSPVSCSGDVSLYQNWPEPISAFIGLPTEVNRSASCGTWNQCVEDLLIAARAGQSTRRAASLRLFYLNGEGLLTTDEVGAFSGAMWSELDNGTPPLPALTHIYQIHFASLPGPRNLDVKRALNERFYGEEIDGRNSGLMEQMVAAVLNKGVKVAPTESQAVELFDKLLSVINDLTDADTPFDRSLENLLLPVSRALAIAVIPAMRAEDRNLIRFDELSRLSRRPGTEVISGALPYFAHLEQNTQNKIVERIRTDLLSVRWQVAVEACAAIETWLELQASGNVANLPNEVVETLMGIIETRRPIGLASAINCAHKIVQSKTRSADIMTRLGNAILLIFHETNYDGVVGITNREVSAPGERVACVRLAHALANSVEIAMKKSLREWLDDAKKDALPEVREAANSVG
jgi:tetratricopeptide (TPR) repeat protein